MGDAAFHLAECGERIEHSTDVLRRRDLHHLHEPEVRVDVDHSTVRHEGEGHVAVALAVLVEFFGGAVVVLERLVEHDSARRVGHRHPQRTHRVDHVGAVDGKTQRVEAVRSRHVAEQLLAHAPTCTVNSAAAHPGLPRGRRAARAADGGGDRLEQHRVDAEHAARDLLREHDKTLADFRGGELQRGYTVGETTTGCGVVVESFAVHQVLH